MDVPNFVNLLYIVPTPWRYRKELYVCMHAY